MNNINIKTISEIFPTEPIEIAYAASYAVTTAALTALSYYAPITFFAASIPLALTHIVIFNDAVMTSDHKTVKAWMVTACVVAGAFMTVQITYFTPFLPWGATALKTLDLSSAILYFTVFTGSIGFGGAAVKKLYQMGLELSKTPVWEPMRDHMEDKSARESITSFWDKFDFSLGVIAPSLLWCPDDKIAKMRNILFNFMSEDQKEALFKQLIIDYRDFADAEPEQAQTLLPQITKYYNSLPEERQIDLLPQLIAINRNALPDLSSNIKQIFKQRNNDVSRKDQTFLNACEEKRDNLYNRINGSSDKSDLEQISKDFTNLLIDINEHCSNMKLYCPDTNLAQHLTLQTQLMTGEEFKKLQQLNSKNANEDDIDLEDLTWNFFLMEYTRQDRTQGNSFIEDLCENLAVTKEELDEKLESLGIGTIGEFLKKVLGGDTGLIANQNEVLNRLDEYVSTKNDSRGRIYTLLGGKPAVNSYPLELAGNAVYKSAMIITAIAPIIIYPRLTTLGLLLSMTYHIPSVAKVIDSLNSSNPNANNIFECTDSIRYYSYIFNVATRRPFFSLLTSSPTGEMITYASSDTLGKMRILATEFFLGCILLNARFDSYGKLSGLGGVMQGIAMGREASKLALRFRRRFSTQAL